MYAAKVSGSLRVSTEFTASAQNHRPTLPEPSLPIDPNLRRPSLLRLSLLYRFPEGDMRSELDAAARLLCPAYRNTYQSRSEACCSFSILITTAALSYTLRVVFVGVVTGTFNFNSRNT